MKNILLEFLAKNNITVIESNKYNADILNKVLEINMDEEIENLCRGFSTFFCVIVRNSHIEKRAVEKLEDRPLSEVRIIFEQEVYRRLLQIFHITDDYSSEYPNLYRFIVKTMYRIGELNIYKPLDRPLSFVEVDEIIPTMAANILKNPEYVMTGSFALSLQGSIYRNYNAESGLHDIDVISANGIYTMMQYIDTLPGNIIKVYHNHRKIVCLMIPEDCTISEYLIKGSSLVYYTIVNKEGKEVGGFEFSERRARFVKWGVTSLLLDFVQRPQEQINKAIEIEFKGNSMKIEHYSSILKVKLEMDRLKDSMDYAVFKKW